MAASRRRSAEFRRRRFIRTVAIVCVVALTGGLALALSGGEAKPDSKPTESPSPTAAAACGADAPAGGEPKRYDAAPEMTLEDGTDYFAVVDTSCGAITIDLLEKEAPVSVNNFVFLAREGFYDGLPFYRVERNSLVETGDPQPDPIPTSASPPDLEDNLDDPGYTIPDELPKSNEVYTYGTVAMVNEGPNTSGSRFFIVVHDPDPEKGFEKAGFRPDYSVFGRIDPDDADSVETLQKIATVETMVGDDPRISTRPVVPVFVNSVEIAKD